MVGQRSGGGRMQAIAGGGGEAEDGDDRQSQSHHAHCQACRAYQPVRQVKHGIADDAAKAGRQRPAIRHRQGRSQARHGQRAPQPQGQPHPCPSEMAAGHQPPAPEYQRRQHGDAGQASQLHHQIGGDGAGRAKQVADGSARGMIEAGILDRPGHQRQAHGDTGCQQQQAGDFSSPPRQKNPQPFRNVIGGGETGCAHGPVRWLAGRCGPEALRSSWPEARARRLRAA